MESSLSRLDNEIIIASVVEWIIGDQFIQQRQSEDEEIKDLIDKAKSGGGESGNYVLKNGILFDGDQVL